VVSPQNSAAWSEAHRRGLAAFLHVDADVWIVREELDEDAFPARGGPAR
jgi:hypothetical protein